MFDASIKRGGGFLMTEDERRRCKPKRMTAAASVDFSWLSKARVTDDQLDSGACGLFAAANWAEVMRGIRIPSRARLSVYGQALRDLKLNYGSGLYIDQVTFYAKKAGWLPGINKAESVSGFGRLPQQPLLIAYQVTPAWYNTNAAGCLDHKVKGKSDGPHLTLCLGEGLINGNPNRAIYVENSWGEWGWRGIGLMTHTLHNKLCLGIWRFV